MFSFLQNSSQAGAQLLIPGPQIYSHLFDGLSLVLPVSQSTWMGWLQTFTGTAISAVETILLAVEAQFHWGGAHISCSKSVKPHQSSVIRSASIFFPSLSSLSTFSHASKSSFASSQSPSCILSGFFGCYVSPHFSSPVSSSFTALPHHLLHFLCPSSLFLRSLLFFFLCPHLYPLSRSSINNNSSNRMYPLKRRLSWNS